KEYVSRGFPEQRVVVAPDAVDLARFAGLPDRKTARRSLGMPEEPKVICYTGHLYEWKGAHTLALASSYLPEGYLVYVVGGTSEDLEAYRGFLGAQGLERVRAVGHVPPNRVPAYLAAADALALPNSGRSETSSRHTSPMKLFEYMAAGRPIVASRLPSLLEVLRDGENALLVKPDDPEALAKGLVRAVTDRDLASRIAEVAREEVAAYSWDARAKTILTHLEKAS
ncbi:MAG TPA: glycosyltransferase family 4 protein, partial [Chloroflexota bacterium]